MAISSPWPGWYDKHFILKQAFRKYMIIYGPPTLHWRWMVQVILSHLKEKWIKFQETSHQILSDLEIRNRFISVIHLGCLQYILFLFGVTSVDYFQLFLGISVWNWPRPPPPSILFCLSLTRLRIMNKIILSCLMLRQSTAQCTRQMRLPLFSFPYAWITTNLPLIWTDCQLAQVAHINGSILPIFRIKPKQKSILSPHSMIFIISWTYDNIMVINHPLYFSFMTADNMIQTKML